MLYRRYIFLLFIILGVCLSTSINAQDGHEGHDHEHHEHEHSKEGHAHKNEISLAVGVVPIPKENVVGASLHLHYVRGLGEKRIVGLGASVEAILERHTHITFSPILHVRVYKGLIAGYAPGLLLLIEPDGTELQFAQHIEVAYEFEVGRVHLGPVFELGIEKEGLHYTFGAHVGIDF